MMKDKLANRELKHKVLKTAFLLSLVVLAGFSLVNLTAMVTRASFEQAKTNSVATALPATPTTAVSSSSSSTALAIIKSASSTGSITATTTSLAAQASSSVKPLAMLESSASVKSTVIVQDTSVAKVLSQTKTLDKTPTQISTKTLAKTLIKTTTPAKPKPTAPAKSYTGTIRWAASATQMMSNMASFDYSYAIRRSTMNKIENYARLHHVTLITASFINSIQD